MSFHSEYLKGKYRQTGYRLSLALFGSIGFVIAAFLTMYYNPIISKLVIIKDGVKWEPVTLYYPWGYYTLLLGGILFIYILFIPKIVSLWLKKVINNSLAYGVFLAFSYIIICSTSLYNFGLDGGLVIQFCGFAFILSTTEFLKGFEFKFDFASDVNINPDARMKKLSLLHQKWFRAIGALITVAVAVLITSGFNLIDSWRSQMGEKATELMIQRHAVIIAYAAVGLVLGTFTQLFMVLEKIENHFDEIKK